MRAPSRLGRKRLDARGFGQRELAGEAGLDPGSVARMLRRWTAAGLVARRQQDGLPRYYASTDPALAPLVTLMQQDSTLVRTLREALSGVKGIDVALGFGSMARGAAGAGSDVDVLVLGSASEPRLNAALKPAGRALGRAVRVRPPASSRSTTNYMKVRASRVASCMGRASS